jgi:dihydrofolate synthase / folylpolyglutamate synthase
MISHPVLDGIAAAGVRMGLGRMRGFLADCGHPEGAAPVFHVGGTNGKGSVCLMASALLQAAGRRVGTHTSPHLQQLNERFLLDGRPISDEALTRLIEAMDVRRKAWAREALPPEEAWPLTYFEFTVACAFQAFAEARVDHMVIEVGMGGRLDATNVVAPEVTAIVTVGLDHCAELGNDEAAIAGEKAGIIKPGVPIVVGRIPGDALQVIRSVAAERGAPLHVLGKDFDAFGTSEQFRYAGAQSHEGLRLGMLGDHQVVNAAVALRMLEVAGFTLTTGQVHEALSRVAHPGRLEWLAPNLLLDGAHNPAGASTLANYLAGLPRDRRRTLLLGSGTDKDVHGVATTLASQVDRIYTTAGSHPKARSPFEVAGECEGLSIPVTPAGPLREALSACQESGDLIIVAGSLYLVGEVRDLFEGLER